MYTVRLVTLIILLFSASLNTIVFAGLTYDNESLNGKLIGEAIWDQKVVKNVRGAVKPSISRPARQRSSPRSGSEVTNSTQWERSSYVQSLRETFESPLDSDDSDLQVPKAT
ncbi:hypothetical protein Rs2_42016 [Raphanus sativus]|nr:hypothetical protein Rs2_42016 [Raphanus sativus]